MSDFFLLFPEFDDIDTEVAVPEAPKMRRKRTQTTVPKDEAPKTSPTTSVHKSVAEPVKSVQKPVQQSIQKTAPTPAPAPSSPLPLTISALTLRVKGIIDPSFTDVYVVGQISNLSRPRSGHVYLTLKDERTQISAVIWKSTNERLRFKLADGMEVVCRGKVEVYQPHGKYHLIISKLEPKGIGAQEIAFRQLRDTLAREGLFDQNRKKPLPKAIRRIALITSPAGAAVHDFLQVLGRRSRRIDTLLIPVRVQGDGAAAEIAEAIRAAHRLGPNQRIDCIVVTRGGGGVEDLWSFNEEILVRAVAASRIPIVSGVGHEIDVTLCDLAADVRALTPSEAAERISPDDDELARRVHLLRRRLEDTMERRLRIPQDRLRYLANHPTLSRPERIIEDRARAVDLREERLDRMMDKRIRAAGERLAKAITALDALSPLAVLTRGYSLTETLDGRKIQRVAEVSEGERIRTRLQDGTLESVVQKVVS